MKTTKKQDPREKDFDKKFKRAKKVLNIIDKFVSSEEPKKRKKPTLPRIPGEDKAKLAYLGCLVAENAEKIYDPMFFNVSRANYINAEIKYAILDELARQQIMPKKEAERRKGLIELSLILEQDLVKLPTNKEYYCGIIDRYMRGDGERIYGLLIEEINNTLSEEERTIALLRYSNLLPSEVSNLTGIGTREVRQIYSQAVSKANNLLGTILG